MKFNDILFLILKRRFVSNKLLVQIYYNLFLLKKNWLKILVFNFVSLSFVERYLLKVFFSLNLCISLLILPIFLIKRILFFCIRFFKRRFFYKYKFKKNKKIKIYSSFLSRKFTRYFHFDLRFIIGLKFFRILKKVVLFNYKLNFLLSFFFLLFTPIKDSYIFKSKLLRAFLVVNKFGYLNNTLRDYTKNSLLFKNFMYLNLIKKYFLNFFLVRFFKKKFLFLHFKLKRYFRRLKSRKSLYRLIVLHNKLYSLNSFDWNKKNLHRSLYHNKSIERIYSFYSFRYQKYKNFRYFFYINKLNFYLDNINKNYAQFKYLVFFLLNEFNFLFLGNTAFVNVLKDNNRKKNQYFFNVMESDLLLRLRNKIIVYVRENKNFFKNKGSFYLFVSCYNLLISIIKDRVIWENKLKYIYDLFGNFFYNKKIRKILNIPYSGKLSLLENTFSSSKRYVLLYSKLRIKYFGKIFARARQLSRMRSLMRLTVGKISRLRKFRRFRFNDYIPFKYGMLHLKFVFNNVFMTLTSKKQDNVVFKLSSGSAGYKGAAKSTPYTRTSLINSAIDQAFSLNYKVLDLKFFMRPHHWFFEAFIRKFLEKKMCVRLLFYHPVRTHGYIRFRKKRYL